MKKFVTGLLLLLLASFSYGQNNNEEFRANWVITWEHSSSGYSAEQGKARIREILENQKAGNFNAVLWQARQSGTSYYNSPYEPWGYYVGSEDPGYDPLAYAIQEGHKRGLEVHAWFNVFQTSSTAPGAPAAEHPEWICRDGNGNPMSESIALSPGLEEVREYTVQVAMEIVRNYDIDGLHLDYVRWNEYDNSDFSSHFARLAEERPRKFDGIISPEHLRHLQQVSNQDRYLYDVNHPYSAGVPSGFGSWEEWWRWSVTEIVRTLHDSIQAEKPWVRLSAAALGKYNWGGWQGYGTVYQDAALWFNEGYIDQLTPMHYHWDTGNEFYGMLKGDGSQSWEPWLTAGIDAGRLYTVGPGSYNFARWNKHPEVVKRSRDVAWTDGFQFFSYGTWESYDYWEEASNSFFSKKTKIRDTGLIVDQTPGTPSISVTKQDSLHYKIDVTPHSGIDKNQWFAIYRSADNAIDVDADEIIRIHFGDVAFTCTDAFTGLQDYNGTYTYFATQLDRYWNESGISNTESSDPIPSFAPTITSTFPGEGDTVAVNADITFTFSKTVDTVSVEQALTISPPMDVNRMEWNEENNMVTIYPDGYLAFDTDYTLTIAESATDVNGRHLDGNGDGVEGDPFTLHFTTFAVDNVGPQVVTSYPSHETYTENVDVGAVVSYVFDEIVDENTISISMTNTEGDVPFAYIHTVVDNRSVIDIQPEEDFAQFTDYTVTVDGTLSDTLGNTTETDIISAFTTSEYRYSGIRMIDDFNPGSDWKQPGYSGSTKGIVDPNSSFGFTRNNGIPSVPYRRSAFIKYEWDPEWDPAVSPYLLRDYLAGGSAREVEFDTTYTLQSYIYGDGSHNKFRFCVDDDANFGGHEVSKWVTLDWYGWRLIEWDLSDTSSIGTWIGNGVLNGTMRVDSYQLTYDTTTGAITGKVYFDEFRLAKKTTEPSAVDEDTDIPYQFTLEQNYPNPFNPVTNIRFTLPASGIVQLAVYDISGRRVAILKQGRMEAGVYEVPFDGSSLSSGIYFYRLQHNQKQITRRMALIK